MRAVEFITESKTVEYEGLTLKINKQGHVLMVDALDDWGNKVLGHVKFNIGDGRELDPQDLAVDDKYQGQGIARVMYDYVKSLGYTINRSWDQTDAGAGFWNKHRGEDVRVWEQGVAEGATVTRIDSKPITDFGSSLKAYKHTDDWSQSGVDTGDDSYWKNKNLKTNTTKGLFAGDPKRTALYATGNAHETRYVEFTQNGQPVVYFDQKDLPAMRSRKTYLTVFDAANFKKLPTGEYFSENPGQPLTQTEISDPFQYIASQGWIVRVTPDLNKVFKQVQYMHQNRKIQQYGAEGMSESIAEGADKKYTIKKSYTMSKDGVEKSVWYIMDGDFVVDVTDLRRDAKYYADKWNAAEKESSNASQNLHKQGVAEGLTEYKNTPLQDYNGLQFMIDSNHPYLRVKAFAPGSGQQLAQVDFKIDDQDELHPEDLHVEERWRGQGIAQIMYDFVKSKGYTIHRSWSQTDAGAGFWDKHRGEERVWEQGVAENFADGKNPGRKGLSRRVGIPKKATLGQLEKIAKSSTGERRRMAQWQLNMRRGKKK